MLTCVFAWILPDAETSASRSRFWTFSVATVLPFSFFRNTLAATTPADHEDENHADEQFLARQSYEPPETALIGPRPRTQ